MPLKNKETKETKQSLNVNYRIKLFICLFAIIDYNIHSINKMQHEIQFNCQQR